ncbi:MAG: hypothetical protein AAF664_26130, partial [Planctomycetota bacterium]
MESRLERASDLESPEWAKALCRWACPPMLEVYSLSKLTVRPPMAAERGAWDNNEMASSVGPGPR